jgi:hypothetical protein
MGYPIRPPTFSELVEGTDKCKLDAMHKERVEALIVYDPKKELLVPSRFCSFHLAGFDLDEKCEYLHSEITAVLGLAIDFVAFILLFS